MKRILLLVPGLFLLLLCLPFALADGATGAVDPNEAASDSSRVQDMSRKLEDLIRELRELRADYYLQKTQDDTRIEKARSNLETLEDQVEDLRRQEEELDQQIDRYQSEVEDLDEGLASRSTMLDTLKQQVDKFSLDQKSALTHGIPYKKEGRTARLDGACEDCNDANNVSLADVLGGLWSYTQEELRLARSSETYTDRAPGENGSSPYARYFRVGQLILGYVTEDGRQTGIWSALSDGNGWLSISDPKLSGQVRDAVEILDRRQAPRLLMLPVAIQPVDVLRGDRQ